MNVKCYNSDRNSVASVTAPSRVPGDASVTTLFWLNPTRTQEGGCLGLGGEAAEKEAENRVNTAFLGAEFGLFTLNGWLTVEECRLDLPKAESTSTQS